MLITLFMLAIMSVNLMAENVDVNKAKAIGVKFLNSNTKLKVSDLDLAYTSVNEKGNPCFYVFTNKGNGFVIVSADDRMKPILGYSSENNFNSNSINPALNSFFQNYIAAVDYVVESKMERCAEAKRDWEAVETTGKVAVNRVDGRVEPLIKTTWNQSDIYNSMCPEDPAGFGGHVKSGCVANAMAQIMNYWQWPQIGEGSYSYQSDYGILDANFGATEYKYEMMPKFLDYTSPQEEVDAVAILQYQAGVSVDMMYGPTGSGAYSYYVPFAMKDHFRYDSDTYSTYIGDVDGGMSAWENKLRESIDREEPLYYSAYGPDGGHAFVCSGYDENNLFHFNWGWQGFDNGYYAIDNFYLTYHDFPYGHEAIFNVRPKSQYYNQPKTVDNVKYETDDENYVNTISFDVPVSNLNEASLTSIDSVVVLRNNTIVYCHHNPTPGETLTFEDQLDRNGVNYYKIYSVANGLKSHAVIDTVMTGQTYELKFNLYDSDDDGWLSPSISILDSRGIVVKRLGLEKGGFETVTVSVPDNDTLTFFWNYVNAAYSDEDDECSFEIVYSDSLLYKSVGKPQVGPLMDFYVNHNHLCVDENTMREVDVFPNPVTATLNISGIDAEEIIFYNYSGREMTILNDSNVINVSDLPAGLYMMAIKDKEGRVLVKKFVKK